MGNEQEFIKVKNFIDGQWVEETGVELEPIYNPSTGEQIGEVPISTPEASAAAVESSYAAYDAWRHLPVGKRVGYLFDMRRAMQDNVEELAVSIAIDQAKHISEARGEVQRVIEILETACGIPTLIQGDTLEGISNNINKGIWCS